VEPTANFGLLLLTVLAWAVVVEHFDLSQVGDLFPRNWSLWFDIKIICLTLWRGFFSKNAY